MDFFLRYMNRAFVSTVNLIIFSSHPKGGREKSMGLLYYV